MQANRIAVLFLLVFGFVVTTVTVDAQKQTRKSGSCGGLSDCAYSLVNSRVPANQQSFFVYLDQDSGFNHGFPVLFADPSDQYLIGEVKLDPGCLDDPNSTIGCSSDNNKLDQNRVNVFRVTFPALTKSGQYVGLNFEDRPAGYDLTPATQVQFDIRSPDQATVEISVNEGANYCLLAIIKTSTSWMNGVTLSIPSFCLTPPLNVLFTVATNTLSSKPVTVLLDNIQFTPVPNRQKNDPKAMSLPLSTQTFGVVPVDYSLCPQQAPCFPPDQVNRNVTTIYESALTVLAFFQRGQPADITNAMEVANTLDYALYHDNHGDYIPTQPGATAGCYGGSGTLCGLHSAYSSGDIALNSGQPEGAQAGDGRLAGFSAKGCNTGFCLVYDGATGGNNAYAMLAFLAAYQQTKNNQYLNDAAAIGNWIYTSLHDTDPHSYGGYFAGYFGYGDCLPPPAQCLKGMVNLSKSTENNADIYAAYTLLAQTETSLHDTHLADQFTGYANIAGDFVMQMYNNTTGSFNLGTLNQTQMPPVGSAGACPDRTHIKDNDILNTCPFLDANTFAILALGGSTRYAGPAWDTATQYMLNASFAQQVTAHSLLYQGFDLVMTPTYGANGIAWEFTGQAVETLRYVDQIYSGTSFENTAASYLQQIRQAQLLAPFGDGMGVVASTLQNGDNLHPYTQCLGTPFQCIPERVGLAATVWAILSQLQINPEIALPALTNYTLTLAVAPPGTGTITAVPPSMNGVYTSGTEVCLNAQPNQGYYFAGWTGDSLNKRNCLVMTANKSVTADFSVFTSPTPAQFVAVPPCRLLDTRPQYGGSGPILGGTFKSFNLPQLAQSRGCASLSTASAYSLNVTVIPQTILGYLTIWPAGQPQPPVSTLNSPDGRIKADAAIVQAGTNEEVSVYVTDTTNVILDIDGYFAPASNSTLAFYPLTPCRVVDTRQSNFPPGLGPPQLSACKQRGFPVLNSSCIPSNVNAAAYSFNFTVVPGGHKVGYLSVWPTGNSQPVVSTLNDQTGTIVANAAIVPAGTGGQISVYSTDDTQLLIDINGYFALAGQGGLSLYPLTPCRVINTRPPLGSGAFSGTISPPVNVVDSECGAPGTAQAYVFNATVVPPGPLGYLTLWPDGTNQPVVSTLNAIDGAITNNMAIVPSTNGQVDAYAGNGLTQLILDISSYFAP